MSMAKPPKDFVQQQQRLCPLLTAGVIKAPTESKVVGLDGKKTEDGGYSAVPCAGQACAFFTPVFGDDGRPRGGNCAMTLIPSAIAMLSNVIAAAVNPPDKKV